MLFSLPPFSPFPTSVRFHLLFLLSTTLCLSTIGRSFPPAQSNRRLFMFRREPNDAIPSVPMPSVGVSVSPLFRTHQFVGVEKRRNRIGQMQPLLAKKFERNCFFSPVQCMLSFKDGSNSMGTHNEWPFEQMN